MNSRSSIIDRLVALRDRAISALLSPNSILLLGVVCGVASTAILAHRDHLDSTKPATYEAAGLAVSTSFDDGLLNGGHTTVRTTMGTFIVSGPFQIRDEEPLVLQTRGSGKRWLCNQPRLVCAALL